MPGESGGVDEDFERGALATSPENTALAEDKMFERRNRWTNAVPAFLIGIGFGTAVGMLLAPKSGAKTRRLISDAAQQGLDETVATAQRWARRASDAANQVRDQVDQVTENVKGAAEAGQRAYNEATHAGHENPYDPMNRRNS